MHGEGRTAVENCVDWMNTASRALGKIGVAVLAGLLALPPHALAQTTAPATPPRDVSIAPEYRGRTVESVRILGNQQVPSSVIRNQIRTREGEPFDPATVQEDYQRIYSLRKFRNVEPKVEATQSGVVVTFIVTEQKQIGSIVFKGNRNVDDLTLQGVVDLHAGEAIDPFRLSTAKLAIERLYKTKNYPFAHVNIDMQQLDQTGQLLINIVEGPNVKVRRVKFIGNHAFTDWRLRDVVQTKYWIWIIRPGTYDPEQMEDDVASLRRYYDQHGFFDARVGRKIIFSPDNSEVEVDFLIDEGVRYKIDSLTFKGNNSLSDAQLRQGLKLVPGTAYDNDLQQRDVRQLVRNYSPLGFIYQQAQIGNPNPDYLRIDPQLVYRKDVGKVDLIYNISEGKPFHVGRIIVKGNDHTQEKVVLRELRTQPGEMYNSGELQNAQDRLKATGYFGQVNITPIGDEPDVRDLLVEVHEAPTAQFIIGAGINSNGGIGANLTYTERNFDIGRWPGSWSDILNRRAFVGAGQTLRLSLEPGTKFSNASILFSEPWIFDQPYSFTGEAYLKDRKREDYTDTRIGGRVTFGKRFNNVYSARLTLRGEDVQIHDINDKPIRAQEILDAEGHSTLTSVALGFTRDTTARGLLPTFGTTTTAAWEFFGAMSGDFTFSKFTLSHDYYHTLSEDLLDRRTVLALHGDAGYIIGNDPFFERFYGGGIGSVRGFAFRGISPRSGPDDDRVGGDFSITGSAEVSFPLASDMLRGVVFADAGMVEPDVRLGTIRTSIGTGIRLSLPLFGTTPVAIDFALPLSKNSEDDTQIISFSLGITP
jgi:outer membrane protein assembly factor BamA